MNKSHFRGYEIELVDGEWYFCDTKEPVAETWEKRACGHCGKYNTTEGHDGCLGTLPGVMNACCGHGRTNEAYVQLWDGYSIHGENAIKIMEILKRQS